MKDISLFNQFRNNLLSFFKLHCQFVLAKKLEMFLPSKTRRLPGHPGSGGGPEKLSLLVSFCTFYMFWCF